MPRARSPDQEFFPEQQLKWPGAALSPSQVAFSFRPLELCNLRFLLRDKLIKLRNLHRVPPLLVLSAMENVHVILRPIAIEEKDVLLTDRLPQLFRFFVVKFALAVDGQLPRVKFHLQLPQNLHRRQKIAFSIEMNTIVRQRTF